MSPEFRRERKGEESLELVRDSGGVDAGDDSQDSGLEYSKMAKSHLHKRLTKLFYKKGMTRVIFTKD